MMLSWQSVVDSLGQAPVGSMARIPASQIFHPLSAGMLQTVGFPVGQKATFSIALSDDISLHVDDFGDFYDVRLSRYLAQAPRPSPPPARTPVVDGRLVRQADATAITTAADRTNRTSSGGVEQAIKDAPGTTLLVTTSLGALLGALGGTKSSAMAGALLGGVAGLAAVSVATEDDPSKKAQMSAELAQMMTKLLLAKGTAQRQSSGALPAGGSIPAKLLPSAEKETIHAPVSQKSRAKETGKKTARSKTSGAPRTKRSRG